MSESIAIIGAGMAGLSAACRLAKAGLGVSVFDKGRGVAGRTSTRHADAGRRFDHGAQYFTVSDPRFDDRVVAWQAAGVVAEWGGELATVECDRAGCRRVDPPGAKARYVGVPGMKAMGRAMADEARAAGAVVSSGVEVMPPERQSEGWRLSSVAGEALGEFNRVLVTAPAPQAATLLSASPGLAEKAARVRVTGCWAVMIALAERLDTGADGLFVNGQADATPLSWAARNGSKPGRPAEAEVGDCWVLHGSPAWSEFHIEAEPDTVIESLLAGFSAALRHPLPEVLHAVAHRWRYALPQNPLPEPCLVDKELGLYAAGDWCGGSKVEGAYLGGVAAAEAILTPACG